jgi:hypothetical protein
MRSCQQCREAKRKCIPVKHNGTSSQCGRCLRHHLPCSHSRVERLGRTRLEARPPIAPLSTESQTVNDFLSDDGAVTELVHEYLSKIHGRPHSIFHTATLWKDICDRQASKALILAICAMGAHVSTQPTLRSLEPLLTAESKRLLQIDLERVCLENIQTCILVANLCVAHANPSSEFLFFREFSSSPLVFYSIHTSACRSLPPIQCLNTHTEREREHRHGDSHDAIDGATDRTSECQPSLSGAPDPNLVGTFCSGQLVFLEPGFPSPDERLASAGSATHGRASFCRHESGRDFGRPEGTV